LDTREETDPTLHEILGRLEVLVDRQDARVQLLEAQLAEAKGRLALCPCGRSSDLATVSELSAEGESSSGDDSEGSVEEAAVSGSSRPVSMTAVGSFHWGSEAGTAVAEPWDQGVEEAAEEDSEGEVAYYAQVFEQDRREAEALEWLAANPTQYEPEVSDSSVDVDRTLDLFPKLSP